MIEVLLASIASYRLNLSHYIPHGYGVLTYTQRIRMINCPLAHVFSSMRDTTHMHIVGAQRGVESYYPLALQCRPVVNVHEAALLDDWRYL